MSKDICIICVIAFLCSLGNALLWCDYEYPKTYEYNLRLADDASLPETKAEYLKAYRSAIAEIKGTPRYVFMRPDLETSKQLVILDGLIKRFEDLAKIAPSEMAYQQGMEQLSGQEIDHQLLRLSGIFKSAALRESGLFFFWLCFVPWIAIIVGVITCYLRSIKFN